jgi:hypothetical protein
MLILASSESIEANAAVATAVGTILTVITALYLQWGRERLRRPELSLSLGRQATGIVLRQNVAGSLHRIKFRVTAARKRRTAHRVEVLVSAAWPVPSRPEQEFLVLDREPLNWVGSRAEHGSLTQTTLAPGISREVSLAWIGRPLDLYSAIGLSRPTDEDVKHADEHRADAPGITGAFGAFDVPQRPEYPPLFIEPHLLYNLRIDLTAQDIETVSYETGVFVQPIWNGNTKDLTDAPTTHADRNAKAVEIAVTWAPLKRVPTDKPFAPMDWKIIIGEAT